MNQLELTDYIKTHLLEYLDNTQDVQDASFYLAEKLLPLITVKKERKGIKFLKEILPTVIELIKPKK
jgi:hypothetical protein